MNCHILLIFLNLIAFLLFGLDKYLAIHNKHRIKEKFLIISAVMFGAIGAIVGMYTFHHKTKKAKFYITVPLLLLFQIATITILYAIN